MAAQRSTRGRRAAQAASPAPPNPEPEPERAAAPARADPLDFETLPLDALRKYRARYGLAVPSAATPEGELLGGRVGKRSWSARNLQRASRHQVAEAVKEHFAEETLRETETIVEFLYAVQNKDNVFKIQFG